MLLEVIHEGCPKNTVEIDPLPLFRFCLHWAIPPPLLRTSANVTKYAVNSDSRTSSNYQMFVSDCCWHWQDTVLAAGCQQVLYAYTCDVTQATLVAQLLYASPAWSGFIKADEKAKLQSILNKTVRYGFFTNYKPVEYLYESSDTTLFSAILRCPGVMAELSPSRRVRSFAPLFNVP